MARNCTLRAGIRTSVGNKISHSNIKTKRKFIPNLHNFTLKSELLGSNLKLKLATRTMRTILKHGSLDEYLLTTRASHLTPYALKLKRRLRKKNEQQAEKTAVA